MDNSTIKRICTICARAGSREVRDKNIRMLGGLPLFVHTLRQALDCGLFETVVFSSDSDRYLELAETYGAPVTIRRPPEFATRSAAKLDAVIHAVDECEKMLKMGYDVVADFDVTSPLRTHADIGAAIGMLENSDAPNVLTATRAHRSPYFNMLERTPAGGIRLCIRPAEQITSRQQAPDCFDMNASIYVWRRDVLRSDPKIFYEDTALYEMPQERSYDIDSEVDFQIVEFLMSKRLNQTQEEAG